MNTDSEIILEVIDAFTPTLSRKRPHITSSWTNEVTHVLFQEVESHPYSWEYSCPEYKDCVLRLLDYHGKISGHDLEGCKAKWANIKSAFLNVKRKMSIKSSQIAESSKPHWQF